MTTHSTELRRRWGRVGIASVFSLVMVAALVSPASARWIRGFSDINTAGDDIAVCDSIITLEATLDHLTPSFESRHPDFVGVPGETLYPGFSETAEIPLFASAADAIARVNQVANVSVPYIFTGSDSSAYRFKGQATISTPAGFENGDMIYTWGIDEDTLNTVGVPFEIGAPEYNCPPSDLPWAVFSTKNTITIGAVLPHTFIFDAREVDPSTLVLTGDNGSARVNFVGELRGFGFARVHLDEIGADCSTRKLVLSGEDRDGRDYERVIETNPVGRHCVGVVF